MCSDTHVGFCICILRYHNALEYSNDYRCGVGGSDGGLGAITTTAIVCYYSASATAVARLY